MDWRCAYSKFNRIGFGGQSTTAFGHRVLPEPERHRSGSASKPCVRVSNSHGSSIAWRLSRAPLTAVWFFDRLQVAAMVVEQLQVVDARCPAAIARDQVIHFHPISFTKPLIAFSASPFLPFEQLGDSRRHFWVITESRTPIQPVSVVRAACSCHLHVTLIVCLAVLAQPHAIRSLKLPTSAYAPIFAHDPPFALFRMTALRPGIEHREEHFPELAESDVTDYIFVVVRPSRDLRIKSLDQLGLFLRRVSLDRFPQFLGVPFDCLWTRLDSSSASDGLSLTISIRVVLPSRILPDPETQKFKTRFTLRRLQRVSDPRFVLVEFQSHLAEPLCDDLTTLLDHFPLFVQDHEIISVSHHFRRTDIPPSWELLADDRFQPVQGNVGKPTPRRLAVDTYSTFAESRRFVPTFLSFV